VSTSEIEKMKRKYEELEQSVYEYVIEGFLTNGYIQRAIN